LPFFFGISMYAFWNRRRPSSSHHPAEDRPQNQLRLVVERLERLPGERRPLLWLQ
jgi:hypothetical protein